MKKWIVLCMVVLCSMALIACSDDASGDNKAEGKETIILKAGTNLPSNHLMMEYIMNPFMEKVEKETDGRVKFEVYDSESLVRAGEELEALKSGTIDIAIPMYDVYDVSRFPFAEIALLPTLDTDIERNAEAMRIFASNDEPLSNGKTYQETVYEKEGIIGWPFATTNSYTIGSVGKPIESLSDLTSMQIRVPSNIHEIYTKKLGASPVNISINETFDAFNRGTLDGGFTIIADWESYGFDEVFKYAVDGINAGVWPSTIAMTQEKFDSLPEDIQEILANAIEEAPYTTEAFENINALENDVLENFYANDGIYQDVNELPDEVTDRINEAVAATWIEWIDNVSKKEDLALEVALRWRDAILEAGGELPDEVKALE